MITDEEIILVLADGSEIDVQGMEYTDEEIMRYYITTCMGHVDGPMAVSNMATSCGTSDCCPLNACLANGSNCTCSDC